MAKAFICDRCGDVYKWSDVRAYLKSPLSYTHDRNIYNVHNERNFSNDADKTDLCPVCILKLNAWMRKYVDGKRYIVPNDFYEVIEETSGLPLFPQIDYDIITKFENADVCGNQPAIINLDDGIPRGPKCVEDFVSCIEPGETFGIFKAIAREMNFAFFNAVRDLDGDKK